MELRRTGGIAVAAAILALVSAPVGASDYGRFHSFISKQNVYDESRGYFTRRDSITIVGATIVVQGQTGGGAADLGLAVVEFSGKDMGEGIVRPLGRGVGPWRAHAALEEKRNVGTLAVALATPEMCNAANEPVLWAGPENQYQINWCKKYGSTSPKWAKKNYYYLFSNGTPQLVATVRYNCNEPGDTAQMPAGVYPGACQ